MRLLKDSKRGWITGASSGIGEECAVEFARRGASLVISGRRLAELDRVAERCRQAGASRVRILAFDLSDTGILEEVSAKAWEFYGGIDILYCNAGISQRCDTDDADIQTIRKVMEVDYFAPVIITKAILHRMIQSGGGQLACTGSIAGLFGSRQRCAYGSAKAAIQRFYETIAAEYYDNGIRTTVIVPGRVRTNISFSALEAGGKPHGVLDNGQAKGISAEKAARVIVDAILRGKREKLVGGIELSAVWIKRFFPALSAVISRKVKN